MQMLSKPPAEQVGFLHACVQPRLAAAVYIFIIFTVGVRQHDVVESRRG